MTELKPCPFCGGEAELYSGGIKYVLCKECLATSNDFKTEAEAIKAWNTRHERTCNVDRRVPGAAFCDECAQDWEDDWSYCPKCGRKAVE